MKLSRVLSTQRRGTAIGPSSKRLTVFWYCLLAAAAIVIFRLFWLQVLHHGDWKELASLQHERTQELLPDRGIIFAQDTRSPDHGGTAQRFPVALNEDFYLVYAQTFAIEDPVKVTEELNTVLALPPAVVERITTQLSRHNDPYEPLVHRVTQDKIDQLAALNLPGIKWETESLRSYPNGVIGSNVLGFVGWVDDALKGQYGIEGYFEKELAGHKGFERSERDARGRLIGVGDQDLEAAQNGADVVLTIDNTLQDFTCRLLDRQVEHFAADGGTIIILQPTTGAVLAMCGNPDFNPNDYSAVESARAYTNPAIFDAYEPGSVFKAITMAGAVDVGAVTPQTTYTDTGEEKIGSFSIRNFDDQAYGVQNMVEVLKQSLNLGAIFVMRQMGADTFRDYVERFGFGAPTGIELATEVNGSITSLKKRGEIYPATASFGQGITATPIQLAAAYAAIINGGKLMKPYIVDRVIAPDGTETVTEPTLVRQVISPQTSSILNGMLAEVVRTGHSTRAQVGGYYIGGKTGTAQIADPVRGGYGNQTIQTFIGFGPVSRPVFVALVRFDRPKNSRFADGSAVPTFQELARFILNYYAVEPDDLTSAESR